MMYRIQTPIFLLLLAAVLFGSTGCAPKIYTDPTFPKAKALHENVAILPFNVTVDAKKLPKDITLETVKELEKDEAYLFQEQLYGRFLQRYSKDEYTVTFQDISRTNALLAQADIAYEDLSTYTREEIAGLLGVDAVIAGTIRRSRPTSTGAAVAVGVLFGVWANTNRVDASMELHDGDSGRLLWKYDHKASGSVGSSSEGLAKSLMKSISKRFPYRRV